MHNPNRRKLDLTRPRDRKIALLMCLIGVVSILIGSILAYSFVFKPIQQIRRSKHFVEIPCMIKSMQRYNVPTKGGSGRFVAVRYTYEFEGKTYESDKYGFSGAANSHKGFNWQDPGTKSTCFVNPDNPVEAVMSRECTKTFYINILVPLVFLLLGTIVTLGCGYNLANYYKQKRR